MATGGLLLIFWPEGGFSSHPSELKDGNENKRVLKQLIPTAHIFHPLPERKGQTKSLFLAPFLNSEKNVSGANRHNALDVGITLCNAFQRHAYHTIFRHDLQAACFQAAFSVVKIHGILRDPVPPDLKMAVRSAGISGTSYISYHLPFHHGISNVYNHPAAMGIAGL